MKKYSYSYTFFIFSNQNVITKYYPQENCGKHSFLFSFANFKINHIKVHIIKIRVFNNYSKTVYSKIHIIISLDYIIGYKHYTPNNKMSHLGF